MLSFLCKNRIHMNPELREICNKSTNDFIRKITQKCDKERKMKQSIISTNSPSEPNSNIGMIIFACFFLSSSTYLYYFYKGPGSKYVFF